MFEWTLIMSAWAKAIIIQKLNLERDLSIKIVFNMIKTFFRNTNGASWVIVIFS